MEQAAGKKRLPAWLRRTGWLAFGVLSLVFVLVVARWWVMSSGHRRAQELVKHGRKFTPVSKHPKVAAKVTASTKSAVSSGIPLADLPYFGTVLTGDENVWMDCLRKMMEIKPFFEHRGSLPTIVDGLWSFRAILQNMGIEVSETMTEAEAAAEYLKQADRFSDQLAKWREAVAKGPLAPGGEADWESKPGILRFRSLTSTFNGLLRMTAEAHLCAGDPAAAWMDLQAIKNSSERVTELLSPNNGYLGIDKYQILGLARSGIRSGAWTNDQLSELSSMLARENALDSAKQNQEIEKKYLTDYYSHFQENKNNLRNQLLNTDSSIDWMFNQLALSLTTEQQIQDNLALMCHRVDQRLSCFDSDTGFYIRPTAEDHEVVAESRVSSNFMDSLYFFYSRQGGAFLIHAQRE